MQTLEQAHSQDASYWGERGHWLIVLSQHRDSEIIDQSNFAVALAQLGGESETVAVERSSHWAVGWAEYLVIDPACAELVQKAEEIRTSLEDYPLLDEEDHSRREYDEFLESWDFWGRADFKQALAKRIRANYPDGISEDFGDTIVLDAFDELDNEAFDKLQADTDVNWLYQSEGSGVTINIDELAKAADYESLLEAAIEACWEARKADDIRKLGACLGACQAEQALAVRQGIDTVSGFRALMQGMI